VRQSQAHPGGFIERSGCPCNAGAGRILAERQALMLPTAPDVTWSTDFILIAREKPER